MKKLLGICAAAALTAAFAMPAPASAAEKRADGLRNTDQVTEFSAKKRKKYRRHVHRYHAPRYGYYRPYRPYYYDAPYYAYAPRYYRPYYRPGVSVGVGPFGFGFGF